MQKMFRSFVAMYLFAASFEILAQLGDSMKQDKPRQDQMERAT
jgi:hypothetical protein